MPSELPARVTVGQRFLHTEILVFVGVLSGMAVALVAARTTPLLLFALPPVWVLFLVLLERVFLAPCLLVLAVPVGLVALPAGIDLMYAAGALVVSVVAARRLAGRQAPLRFPAPLGWGGVLLALALAGLLRAPSVELAVRQVMALVLAVLVVAAVVSAATTPAAVRRVAWCAVVVSAASAVIALQGSSALRAVSGAQVVSGRLEGTFSEPNQFGVYSGMMVLVALGLYLAADSSRQRVAAAVCAGLSATALGLSLSRGSWIGTVTGVGVLLLLLPEARRRLVPPAVAGLALVGAFALAQPDRPEVAIVRDRVTTLGSVTANPYDDRPSIYREALREIREKPWLGQGPGQFPYVSKKSVSESATVSAAHAHNVLLTTAAELGLPAATVVVAFTLALLGRVRRALARLRSPADRALLAASCGALGVVVGQGVVDFTLRNSVVLLVVATVLGLVLALVEQAADGEPVGAPGVLVQGAGATSVRR